MFIHPDDDTHLATNAEALMEFADNAGLDYPEQEWLLTDLDIWVRNTHYCGPRTPHPESYDFEDDRPTDATPVPMDEPEIPF